MINIDFGNSYTKVAIRVDQNSTTQPVKDDALKFDRERLFFCIPTLAAQTNEFEFKFGIDVLKLKDQDVLHVFRNWKPNFFEEDGENLDSSNLHSHPETSEEVDWTAKYQEFVQNCMEGENYGAILSMKEWLAREESRIAAATKERNVNLQDEESNSIDYWELGVGFFRWLRQFVNGYCQDKGYGRVEEFPARITLPSLGGVHSAQARLRALLKEAGWKIDVVNSTLSEPHANYWGMMTEGKNAVWTPNKPGFDRLSPNYRDMLEGSNLLERMRANLNARRDPIFWVLVADIGGFTVDFAMLGLDPYEPTKPSNDLFDGKSREEYQSFPLGVRDLDARLLKALPAAHAEALADMLRDKDAGRLEQFHRDSYEGIRKQKAVRMSRKVRLHTEEWPIVHECVESFSNEVSEFAEKFLISRGYEHVDELLLTGGGFNIPTIRNGIFDFIKNWNAEFDYPAPYAYTPAPAAEILPENMTRLDPLIVRGATVLGGASVAFDYEDQ